MSAATVTFTVEGPIRRADVAGLCSRVCALLQRTRPRVAVCHVRGVDADAIAVDALARLHVAAGRLGCTVRLRGASAELLELIAFVGLDDVLVSGDA